MTSPSQLSSPPPRPKESIDEIDVESLRRVFGSTSPEDLNRRKAHELRELWMEKVQPQPHQELQQQHQQQQQSQQLPRFLLDPKDDRHVPPHAVALQLLLGNYPRSRRRSTGDGDGLYRKVATDDDDDDDENNENDENNDGSTRADSNGHAARTTNTGAPRVVRTTLPKQHPRRSEREHNHEHPLVLWLLVAVASAALACQFVLEVLGGAGAIWGCAELLGLRTGGPGHPSWNTTTPIALGVGLVCLVRFGLVHFVFACDGNGNGNSTFRDKHERVLRKSSRNPNGVSLRTVLELAHIVAQDPVLFLHPTRGPVLSSLCGGCHCVCCGSRWCSFDEEEGDENERVHRCSSFSPPPLGGNRESIYKQSSNATTPSPQRSTFDLSFDDENDDDNDNGACCSSP